MDPFLPAGELTGQTIELVHVDWQLCGRHSIKTRVQSDPSLGHTNEQHEVYDAFLTKIKQEDAAKVYKPPLILGMSAIIKVKKQLEPWSNKSDCGQCSEEINREIHNLTVLTDAGCQNTPRLIEWSIRRQTHSDTLPGGYIACLVMEKVPGKNLGEYDKMEISEQRRVQLAFLEAIWKCQLLHWDPRLPNLIWDPNSGKCYIVDLEDAEHDTEMPAQDFSMDPWAQLMTWQLIREFDRPLVDIRHKEKFVEYWKEHMDQQ